MNFPEIIVTFLGIMMLIPTVASLTRFDQWWIRGFDFPRLQICLLILLMISLCLYTYDFEQIWQAILLVLLVTSFLYQAFKIFPYTALAPKQVLRSRGDKNPETAVSLLVSNVLGSNKRSDKLIDRVRQEQPDMLLTLETNIRWEKELAVLERDYPYTVKVPQDNLYGMHLYSKFQLSDIEVKYLISNEIPSIHGYVVLNNGKRIRIHCLHPKPPSPTEDTTSTNRDAELLLVGKNLNSDKEPILVFGDLNDVAWSRTTKLFQRISGLLDPRRGRGFYNTYSAKNPLLRWPLDHVFHTTDFTLIDLKRLDSIESDHFPIFIELNFEPRAELRQEETEQADQEEKEWTEEKIEEGDPKRKDI